MKALLNITVRLIENLQEIESNLAQAEVSLRDNNDDITKNNTVLGQITQRITDLGGNIEVY